MEGQIAGLSTKVPGDAPVADGVIRISAARVRKKAAPRRFYIVIFKRNAYFQKDFSAREHFSGGQMKGARHDCSGG